MSYSIVVMLSLLKLVSKGPEPLVVELEEVDRLGALPGVEVGRHQVLEGERLIAQDLGHGDPLALVRDWGVVQVEVENSINFLQQIKQCLVSGSTNKEV